MFKDSLQKKLEEMEMKNPSGSNLKPTLKDKTFFLYRAMTNKIIKTSTEEDFERARWDESYRQEFIDGISLEEYTPYVKKVKYKLSRNKIKSSFIGGTNLMTHIFGKGIFNRGGSTIYIWPIAFSKQGSPTMYDFIGGLVDHEGYHAKMANQISNLNYFKNIFLNIGSKEGFYINVEEPYIVEEIRAYTNQLNSNRNLSEKKIQNILECISRYKIRALNKRELLEK